MLATILNAGIGVWLMIAPSVLGYYGAARTNDHIVGPLVATFAVIAAWEATRGLRFVNFGLALWLLAAPFVLGYPAHLAGHSIVIALVLGGLSLVRGRMQHQFDGGWRMLLRGQRGTR